MSTLSSRRPLLVILVGLAATLGDPQAPMVGAQTTGKVTIARVKRLQCTFGLMATGTWTDEKPQVDVKETKLSLEFESIDTDEGSANAKGGFGAPHVVARLAGGNLHFIQVGSSGPVYVTTVFDQLTASKKFKAVHTRHEYTAVNVAGFTSRPEHYYGTCEVPPP
jgi:hypothetical protein